MQSTVASFVRLKACICEGLQVWSGAKEAFESQYPDEWGPEACSVRASYAEVVEAYEEVLGMCTAIEPCDMLLSELSVAVDLILGKTTDIGDAINKLVDNLRLMGFQIGPIAELGEK